MTDLRIRSISRLRDLFIRTLLLIEVGIAFGAADETVLAPGVVHKVFRTPDPNLINVVQIDRNLPQYRLKLGFPSGRRNFPERETLAEIVSHEEHSGVRGLAAINGSFFGEGTQIEGPLVSDGNLIQCPSSGKAAFLWTRSRQCLIRKPREGGRGVLKPPNGEAVSLDFVNRIRGENSITVYTPYWGSATMTTSEGVEVVLRKASFPLRPFKEVSAIVEAVRTGPGSINNLIPPDGMVISARDAAAERLRRRIQPGDRVRIQWMLKDSDLADTELLIGGAGWILKDGKPFRKNWSLYSEEFADTRHPRTAVAWNGDYLWFFTCDGRQLGRSAGMTFHEMAEFLADRLGATDAVNLDGGGSTTLSIGSHIVNHPSDGTESSAEGTPRKIANALLLIEEEKEFTVPFRDDFPPTGRSLPWDDKFSYNGVIPFSPSAPDGDGTVLELKDPSGGYDTVSFGHWADRDYTVEAEIYCQYRPKVKGFERYGIFARDNGGGDFLSSRRRKGNCYALFYESGTGRVRAVCVKDGKITEFQGEKPADLPATGWRNLRIECKGPRVQYFVDDERIAEATDETHKSGPCGIGYHEYFNSNAQMTATYADNFRVTPLD